MTHDLFTSLCHAFHLELREVFIHKFEDGIFSSDLTFIDAEGNEVIIDARTSDAIAIAMRTQSPIYTTPEILEETGFIMEIKETSATEPDGEVHDITDNDIDAGEPIENMTDHQLTELMNKYIEREEYEQAARIKHILNSRKSI